MRMTAFWQKYAGGQLRKLASFIFAVKQERTVADTTNTVSERFFGSFMDEPRFDPIPRLQFPSLMTSEMVLRQHNRADYQHVDPRLMLFGARLIEALRSKGIPMYVHGAYRTKEDQQDAFDRGVSKTVWPKAAHCQGRALDIVHSKYHWDLSDDEWRYVIKVGKNIAAKMKTKTFEIQSGGNKKLGGDWKTQNDPSHWQIKNWSQNLRELPTGTSVHLTPRTILRGDYSLVSNAEAMRLGLAKSNLT